MNEKRKDEKKERKMKEKKKERRKEGKKERKNKRKKSRSWWEKKLMSLNWAHRFHTISTHCASPEEDGKKYTFLCISLCLHTLSRYRDRPTDGRTNWPSYSGALSQETVQPILEVTYMLDISPLRIPSGDISPRLTCHISLSYWSKIRSVIWVITKMSHFFCPTREWPKQFFSHSKMSLTKMSHFFDRASLFAPFL